MPVPDFAIKLLTVPDILISFSGGSMSVNIEMSNLYSSIIQICFRKCLSTDTVSTCYLLDVDTLFLAGIFGGKNILNNLKRAKRARARFACASRHPHPRHPRELTFMHYIVTSYALQSTLMLLQTNTYIEQGKALLSHA